MTPELTARDIEMAIAGSINKRVNLLVSNVSWGLVPWGECDLLQMSGSGYLTEYEIKTCRSDLKREWSKKRWQPHWKMRWRELIKNYFIVIPEEIEATCKEFVPDWAGLMVVVDHEHYGRRAEVRRSGMANKARPLTEKERYQLARLGALRYWRNS